MVSQDPVATADSEKAVEKLMATDFSTIVGFTSTAALLSETVEFDQSCAPDVKTVYDSLKTEIQDYN